MVKHILIFFLVFGSLCSKTFAYGGANKKLSEDINITELKLYIQNVVDEGYQLLQNKAISDQSKKDKISKLIADNLYLEWMAIYTLGRHRRVLSEMEIERFVKTYSKFVVKAYTDLFEYYNGHETFIKQVQKLDEDSYIVKMEIIRPGSQNPLEVSYLIHKTIIKKKYYYKIADIVTEGISVLNSQQAEFNSIISNQGINSLIEDLEAKLLADKNKNSKKSKL